MSEAEDDLVLQRFGSEWARFDYGAFHGPEFSELFGRYFHLFPWDRLPVDAVGFDMGCGSGRWARGVAPRVGTLHCIEPAPDALAAARRNLAAFDNCRFHLAGVENVPLAEDSADFGYCLGVLHHLRDPAAGLRACVRTLKPDAPFLIYVYYALDDRPAWFRALWRMVDMLRRGVSRLPDRTRHLTCDIVAGTVYWPLARGAKLLEGLGFDVRQLPLNQYRERSFYVMRTDALDRLGTPIEHRFSRSQVRQLMTDAGLIDVEIDGTEPYWCALGRRAG